jgi:predicted metal-binding membrane protein
MSYSLEDSVGWMLVFGAVMAAENNLPWGRRLSTPLGLMLLVWAARLDAAGVGRMDHGRGQPP